MLVVSDIFPHLSGRTVRGLWTNSTISNLAGGIEAPGKTFFWWVPFEAVRFEETFGWVVLQEPSVGYIPNKFRLWLIYAWFMAVYQPISYFIVIFILSHPTRINYPRVI
jgi:hypothetical protein